MASKSLAEIIETARIQVNEDTAAFFKDNDIMVLYNLKQIDFIKKTRVLHTETTLSIESDEISVLLPSNFLAIKFVQITDSNSDGKFLFPYGGRARSQGSRQVNDLGYYLVGNSSIKLTQKQSVTGNSINLSYYYLPTAYTDVTDANQLALDTDIPIEYVDIVISGVVAEMLRKRRELQEYSTFKAEYTRGVVETRRYENTKPGVKQLNISR